MIGDKYIKKFLSVLSATAILLSVAAMPASAESSGDFYEIVKGRNLDFTGDGSVDGVINGSDATLALNCYTQLSAGVSQNKIPYYYLIKGYGDMNGDEIITASDATVILNMYTEFSARK